MKKRIISLFTLFLFLSISVFSQEKESGFKEVKIINQPISVKVTNQPFLTKFEYKVKIALSFDASFGLPVTNNTNLQLPISAEKSIENALNSKDVEGYEFVSITPFRHNYVDSGSQEPLLTEFV